MKSRLMTGQYQLENILKKAAIMFFLNLVITSLFLTNKNFQTQLGRQIVFELELETNKKMKKNFTRKK